jgi:hypothetical protein
MVCTIPSSHGVRLEGHLNGKTVVPDEEIE